VSSEQWAVGSGQLAVAKVAIWGIEPGAGACSAGFAPTEQRVQMPVFDHFFYFFATPHCMAAVGAAQLHMCLGGRVGQVHAEPHGRSVHG